MNAGTESRLSGSDCGKLGENAKMKRNEDSGTVCRVQRCADCVYLRLAIIVISIDGGVLKRKIAYKSTFFGHQLRGLALNLEQPMNPHWFYETDLADWSRSCR